MELPDKIKLIDDLIQENPETTIKDYLDLLKDLNGIEKEILIKGAVNYSKNDIGYIYTKR